MGAFLVIEPVVGLQVYNNESKRLGALVCGIPPLTEGISSSEVSKKGHLNTVDFHTLSRFIGIMKFMKKMMRFARGSKERNR